MRVQGVPRNDTFLPESLARYLTRETLIVWGAALLVAVVVSMTTGAPEITPLMLVGALLIGFLLILGDLAAIQLRDGSLLSPAPALIMAGLSMTTWPLLTIAVIIGTILPSILRRRGRRALLEAGGRALSTVLAAPTAALAYPLDSLPLSTTAGLLALPLLGFLVYVAEIAVAVIEDEGPLMVRLRYRLATVRWYALAMVPIGGVLGHLWRVGPLAFVPGLVSLALTQHLFRSQVALHWASLDLERLAGQLRDRGERLEKLQALATAMIGTLDLREMMHILCGRLAALLNAPHGWVVLVDKDNKLHYMAAHNLPLSEDETQAFVNPESYQGIIRRARVVLMTDEYRHDLTPITAVEHSASWHTVLSIPLIAEKRVLGVICLAFDQIRGLDADEQRVLAAFAHQAAITLENARLFDELRHKQVELVQSSKLAAVGTFAAGIAHEFNNLLGSMLGYAELGYGANDLAEKNRSLDVVIQACRRGRGITRGLLTFARRQEHARSLSDLTDAVNETLTLVEIDLRKSKINVVRQFEPLPLTMCDLGQLSQVVLNLITNARDAMKPGGGTLTITLRDRQNQIELSVSDTGCGIPPEMVDKIFEPFVTTKGALGGSQTPGTGLGLSVSYGIIKEHGGTISVTSEVGRGTTMTVLIPVTDTATSREE
ncbi:MAG: ATP-binding protein [Roseiflexaceae bacterium]